MKLFKSLSMLAAACCLSLPLSSQAAADAGASGREISGLLNTLEHSSCQFNRNGSWYSGLEARNHLEQKYQYLQKRGMAATAESFIDLAATASSMSGKAYLVRCGGGPAVESAAWLREQLRQYRAAPKNF